MKITFFIEQHILEPVRSFILPALCIQCATPLPANRKIICDSCYKQLPQVSEEQLRELTDEIDPAYFDDLIVTFQFSPLFQKLIHLLKYRRYLTVARYFAQSLLPLVGSSYDLVTAVPLNTIRLRERGYNQSALIAEHLAKDCKLPFSATVLKRTRNTPSQTKLNREQRQNNVKDAFECVDNLEGTSILLIDDVITTGSTLNACAKVLKESGAGHVTIAAMATPVGILQSRLEGRPLQL